MTILERLEEIEAGAPDWATTTKLSRALRVAVEEIRQQPCECFDEYGKALPLCDRCKALAEIAKILEAE